MPRSVAAAIADSLGERIRSGEWGDDRRIPTERDLARSYRVARNTIRRAMTLLQNDGAISRHVGRGTFATEGARPSLGDIVRRIEGASPADMMEIRILLEPSAAEVAATNASAAELDQMRAAHEKAVAATEMPDFEYWDAELHHCVSACSRNALLKDLHELLRVLRLQQPWFDLKQRSFSEANRRVYCAEHLAIVEALERRDGAQARAAMLAHLMTVRTNLLGR